MILRPPDTVRLLLAVQSYYPTYSGAAQRFRRYAPLLAARGVEMAVFAATPPPDDDSLAPALAEAWRRTPVGRLAPPEAHDGVTVHRVRLPDTRTRLRHEDVFHAAVTAHAMRSATRPDVLQFTTVSRRLAPFAWALRLRRVPILVAWTMMAARDPRDLAAPLRAMWRLPFECADEVVVNSAAMGEVLAGVGTRTPIDVIPNGVDTARFRPPESPDERRALRAELGLPADATLIITTGTVSPRKGHDLLVRAFGSLAQKYSDAHLVILGPRRDQSRPEMATYGEHLAAAVGQTGAASRIHFPGFVPDVERWLRAADAFWFASHQEGLPNAILEAMASGLAVVTTEFIGMTEELGRPGHELIVTPRTSTALADATAPLLTTAAERAAMGEAARRWTTAHLSLERAVDQYAALYRRLAHARPRRG